MIRKGVSRLHSTNLSCALLAFAFIAAPLTPQEAARVKELSLKIMCMCGGCTDPAGTCNHMGGSFSGPCETAQAELKELAERVQRNESDSLILQSFVQEYGPTVLLSPPTTGFDFWAWAMPAIVPLLGIGIVWFLVARWRKRETLRAPATHNAISPDMLDRVRAAMPKDLHE